MGFGDLASPTGQPLGCSQLMLKSHLEKASSPALQVIDNQLAQHLSPSLIIAGVIVDVSSAMAAGGGMALQVQPGVNALIDRALITGNIAGSGSGGGISIEAILPARSVGLLAHVEFSFNFKAGSITYFQMSTLRHQTFCFRAYHSTNVSYMEVNVDVVSSVITSNDGGLGGGVSVSTSKSAALILQVDCSFIKALYGGEEASPGYRYVKCLVLMSLDVALHPKLPLI